MHSLSPEVASERQSPKHHVFHYTLSGAAVALVLGISYLIHHDVTRSFGGSVLLLVVVGACSWYLAPMPALAAGLLGTALLSLMVERISEPPLATALVVAIRWAVLIAVALAVNAARKLSRGVETATERQEAYIAQVAGEMAQAEQDRAKQYNELTQELRTLVGAIQLTIEATDPTSPIPDSMATISDACDRIATVTQRLRDLGRLQNNGPSTASD